ncbi:putative glyoxal oxidase, galactose oxidase/kelch, beta-propeller [Helianthus debilis subsp. tardiflorus]
MQFQLMPKNKAVWFDTTSLGPSARELSPPGNCPLSPEMNFKPDCSAHAIAYDVETVESRTMDGEPWCSSGHLWPNGDLVATSGTRGGYKSIRMLSVSDLNANYVEKKNVLADNRWYSSNQVLEDGSAVVVGDRNSFSYEIVPPNKLEFPSKKFNLKFLQETTVPKKPGPGMYIENNLYPFLFLVPDGNVFLFANDRAIIFHPSTGMVVREFPKQGMSKGYKIPSRSRSRILKSRSRSIFGTGNGIHFCLIPTFTLKIPIPYRYRPEPTYFGTGIGTKFTQIRDRYWDGIGICSSLPKTTRWCPKLPTFRHGRPPPANPNPGGYPRRGGDLRPQHTRILPGGRQ